MVEFGLKLEDNKVADWSDKYLRYDKLKHLLKKCQAEVKHFQELAQKDPDLAAEIQSKIQQGVTKPEGVSHSNRSSSDNLAAAAEAFQDEGTVKVTFTEHSKLLTKGGEDSLVRVNSYGTPPALAPSESNSSLNSMKKLLHKTSGIGGYFSRSLEQQLTSAAIAVDQAKRAFEKCLLQDVERVNNFYGEQRLELDERLQVLLESVSWRYQEEIKKASDRSAEQTERSVSEEKKAAVDAPDEPSSTDVPLGEVSYQPIVDRAKRSISSARKLRASMVDLEIPDDADDEENEVDVVDDVDRIAKVKKWKESESIQRALLDQYRSAKLLHNFAIMNFTGFVKIVKKHDKSMSEDKGKFKKTIEPEHICNEGKEVEALAERLEDLYAKWFASGNRSEARAQMLPKKGDSLEMDWSQLRLGYRMGMCTILGLWVCWDCYWGVVAQGNSTIGARSAFPAFRACGGLLVLQWFWGLSVWVWSRYRINYIFLFDLDPRTVESPLSIFNAAVDNTLVYLSLMLLYYKSGVHDIPGNIPAGVFPFVLVCHTITQLIFPLRTRGPMWASIFKVVTTPASSPSFFHGYIGDIFTSMVKVFQDMAWTAFFIISGDWLVPEDLPSSTKHAWAKSTGYRNILIPILTLLPLWFRFNQCLRRFADTGDRFPHLANAFKYALSQTVTLFGAFHPLYLDHLAHRGESKLFQIFWMFAFVGSSLYSFVWDVYMDWGLGKPKYAFLGPRLMYPKHSMYYAIIAADLVLRFAWVLTLIPPDTGANFALPHYLTAVSMIMELFRRTVWGFLRLENEHKSNTSGFRRVGFVPLHFATGHSREYKKEKEIRGFNVLVEVVAITLVVVFACISSVVVAQRATEKTNAEL